MAAPAEARFFSRRWLVAIAVMSSAVMEVLDTSVVNVSLPHIAGSLSSTVDEATWVLTSYIVANAIILPITGWLSNYFGRKRLLLTVVTGFTLSSVLCGLAPSLPFLIFFRVVQGITGGGLTAAFSIRDAGRISRTGTRQSDGILEPGHYRGPGAGAHVGRLDHG
jgi:MFS family permease